MIGKLAKYDIETSDYFNKLMQMTRYAQSDNFLDHNQRLAEFQ